MDQLTDQMFPLHVETPTRTNQSPSSNENPINHSNRPKSWEKSTKKHTQSSSRKWSQTSNLESGVPTILLLSGVSISWERPRAHRALPHPLSPLSPLRSLFYISKIGTRIRSPSLENRRPSRYAHRPVFLYCFPFGFTVTKVGVFTVGLRGFITP